MTLTKLLERLHKQFVTEHDELIAELVAQNASELTERNKETTGAQQKQIEARKILAQYKPQVETVRFVEEQAAAQGISLDAHLSKMPSDMRRVYEKAQSRIKPYIDIEKGNMDELVVNLVATGYMDTVSLLLPVLWQERQRPVLPGVVYGLTVLAAAKTQSELGIDLADPVKFEDIVKIVLRSKEAGQTVSRKIIDRFMHNLQLQGMPELKSANVSLHGNIYILEDRVIDLSDTVQRVYTTSEAADAWLQHDTAKGQKNGDSRNYAMKMGLRIRDGRIETDHEGNIPASDLDDFFQYHDAKKAIEEASSKGKSEFSSEESAEILGVSRAELEKYVRSGEIKEKDGVITRHSLQRFTKGYTPRNRQWAPFKNNIDYCKDEPVKITKGREHYLTPNEAAEMYGRAYNRVLRLSRRGAFTRYYKDHKKHILFDREELDSHFQALSADSKKDE